MQELVKKTHIHVCIQNQKPRKQKPRTNILPAFVCHDYYFFGTDGNRNLNIIEW